MSKLATTKTTTVLAVPTSTMTTTMATTTNHRAVKQSRNAMQRLLTYDTMQRNGSKASQQHSTKSHHPHHSHQNQQQQQQQSLKHDSSDSGISTHGAQHSTVKSRKGGRTGSSKRSDAGNNGNKTNTTATSTTFTVDDWLGRDMMVYCYERRYIASCVEDNMMPRHNPAHRNSTSSDMAASDDHNSSSSNEDLSATYHAISKNGKKSAKSRQRRQQKRSKQQGNANNTQDTIPMDIDEELKENRRPQQHNHNSSNSNNAQNGSQHHQQPQQTAKQTVSNLRKQCTKAAAIKQLAANASNKSVAIATDGKVVGNSNALANSASSSSVCSSLSSTSSSSSISSSVSSSASSTPAHSAHSSPTASPTISKRTAENFKKIARALAPPLRQHTKLNLSESELVQQLRRFIIDPNLLRVYGYPVESAIHEGCIEIYKCLPKPFTHHHHHHSSNANGSTTHAKSVHSNVINTSDGLFANFPPTSDTDKQWRADDGRDLSNQHTPADSGQGSGNSSPPSVDSDSSEVGEGEDEPATTTGSYYTPDGSYQIFSQYNQSLEKQCVRCKSAFHVTETGDYLSREECFFHWGKLNHMYTASKGFAYQYSCCQGDQSSDGCTRNCLHVWTGAVVGINGPYNDFVHTRARYSEHGSRAACSNKVYALDCEMSFTGLGLEVTKVTVVGYDGQLVYEHFVRPESEIVDYNTRFSGITAQDLCSKRNSVKSLSEVQHDLLQLIDADTLLIGHALDNDLRVLRIVHKTIIDTSVAFPHASGFPYRRALKHLTKVCLNRDIQCSEAGHSSFEDSRACLELMLWKVRKELRAQGEE